MSLLASGLEKFASGELGGKEKPVSRCVLSLHLQEELSFSEGHGDMGAGWQRSRVRAAVVV